MFELYCILNKKNGFRYIGITTAGVRRRFTTHLRNAKNKINRPLYDAMNKYGFDSFKIEFVKNVDNLEQLKKMEIEYIEKYNTFFFDENSQGYNCTKGGEGTVGLCGENHHMYQKKHTVETKIKISNSLKGEKHPQYGLRGKEHFNYGRKTSKETKIKISNALKGRVFSEKTRQKMSDSRIGYKMKQSTKEKLSKIGKEIQKKKTQQEHENMVNKCRTNAHNKKKCEITLENGVVLEFSSIMECARYVKERFELEYSLNAISKILKRKSDTKSKCYDLFYVEVS